MICKIEDPMKQVVIMHIQSKDPKFSEKFILFEEEME